jgi:hypothetical protein
MCDVRMLSVDNRVFGSRGDKVPLTERAQLKGKLLSSI